MRAYLNRLISGWGASQSTRTQQSVNMGAVKDLVESTIMENKVVVFSKTSCPFSVKAKNLLFNYKGIENEEIKIVELDEMEEGPEIQAYLAQRTGQRTVPNIFIKTEHIGGSDALAKADRDGRIRELIA